MRVQVAKEVPLSQVFGHALAAWDYGSYEWYRGVRYSQKGDALAFDEKEEGIAPGTLLCTLTMKGGNYATEAMRIIDDSPACDMNTADVLVQVLAYGECVFG